MMGVELLERHTPTGDLILEWAKSGRYRIVKLDIPPEEKPLSWYIIQVGWFGLIYGVPGSDTGAPGEYNYQLECAGNPIALLDTLADIAATIRALIRYHHICPHKMPPIQDLYQCIRRPLKARVHAATSGHGTLPQQ